MAQRPSTSSEQPGPSTSNPASLVEIARTMRGLKRNNQGAPILNGDPSTWTKEDKPPEMICPICFDYLFEAQITRCGHTYCQKCIVNALKISPKCPVCGVSVQVEQLVPNFAMNQAVVVRRQTKRPTTVNYSVFVDKIDIRRLVASTTSSNILNLNDVDALMKILAQKKEILTAESSECQRHLLTEFLSDIRKIKLSEKEQLEREVALIDRDLNHVVQENDMNSSEPPPRNEEEKPKSPFIVGFNTQMPHFLNAEDTFHSRRRRIATHFDELSRIYLTSRNSELFDINDALVPDDMQEGIDFQSLSEFGRTLSQISRYSALKPLATLSYSPDHLSNSNIVSSIEFDKDSEFFAIAGVTRKIKLFDYAAVIGSAVDIHCPTTELSCAAKISCVAWSNYYKNNLASSDYDGNVNIWDAAAGTKLRTLSEHEKRVWSVDWSNGDPRLLASGSDDSKVKLWSCQQDRSVGTLEAKANVCCVKFCPENSYMIAFGSADHCVHYYDFRHPKEALGILAGHSKAVSYVKFASKYELVSASTDSHLKLWNLETMDCVRSFCGHTNEKNFVGLATDGKFIACGSENNSLYVYYKSLPKPLFHFKFDNHKSMVDKAKPEDSTEFVSAVAWKKNSPVVVAANSQGAIKVLELV